MVGARFSRARNDASSHLRAITGAENAGKRYAVISLCLSADARKRQVLRLNRMLGLAFSPSLVLRDGQFEARENCQTSLLHTLAYKVNIDSLNPERG